jgi:acyl-CoA thioester hydrolase
VVVRLAQREAVAAAFFGRQVMWQVDADKPLDHLESHLMFSIEMRVRYNECDPMGFVHHSNYLTYMEIGRTEMLRASGGRYREMEAAGQFVVVVRSDVRYRKPARYDDLLVVTTEVAKVTAAKIVHRYTIRRDETTIVEADITLAVIDRDGRLQRVPADLRETN